MWDIQLPINSNSEILSGALRELSLRYVHSSGPGGQNVNKVATAVQLRFDTTHSVALPPDIRARLLHYGGKRVSQGGILILDAKRFRSQEKNRSDALERFSRLIQKASEAPKRRLPTSPSAASNVKRLTSKKRRGTIKRQRRIQTYKLEPPPSSN